MYVLREYHTKIQELIIQIEFNVQMDGIYRECLIEMFQLVSSQLGAMKDGRCIAENWGYIKEILQTYVENLSMVEDKIFLQMPDDPTMICRIIAYLNEYSDILADFCDKIYTDCETQKDVSSMVLVAGAKYILKNHDDLYYRRILN